MPRPTRIRGNDIHYHVILRCNNRERLIQNEEDFRKVLSMLTVIQEKFGFKLYNYVLLNAHIHLMLSTHHENYIDQVLHDFCFRYAKDYNQRHGRTGHFWAHRYWSRIILDDRYALACLRYQHRNPLAAGVVTKLEDWRWSGYSYYAFGSADGLLEPHPSYLALAEESFSRRQFYRSVVCTLIPADKSQSLFEGRTDWKSKQFSMMLKQLEKIKQRYDSKCLAPTAVT